MAGTLLEQILMRNGVAAGDIVFAQDVQVAPAHIYGHDRNTFKILNQVTECGARPDQAIAADRLRLYQDHYAPPPSQETAALHRQQRELAATVGGRLFPAGSGVGHQIAIERFASPGEIAVGVDSHTCSIGGLGALGVRHAPIMVADAMMTGRFAYEVPKALRIELSGRLPDGVGTKDVMLDLARRHGQDSFLDRLLEFGGPGLATLAVPDRVTLCNLAIDLRGRGGVCESDDITRDFLAAHGRGERYVALSADPDAYRERIEIDLSRAEPMIALPGSVFGSIPLTARRERERVDVVTVGSCTNGRFEDFEAFARTINGHTPAPGVRMILTPASRDIARRLNTSGLADRFLDLGATLNPPGCGPCMGLHQGVLVDDEVCVTTGNTNDAGRQGSDRARIFLASPQTAARAACTGMI